ncbi:MAG: preprotein translocase subunit YajC [Planctomycetes bacterium]|nr:preprotein translocase subunit YajC [Planctomycetota bacterium]
MSNNANLFAVMLSEATADGAKPADGSGGAAQADGGLSSFLPIILIMGMLFLFMFISGRGRKKQQAKFASLYENLKRDDRIMLQNGKFVVVDKVEKDRITVFADVGRNVREVYHKNAVASLERDVFPDTEVSKSETTADA